MMERALPEQRPALEEIAKTWGEQQGISVAVQTVANDLQPNFITANQAGNGPDITMGAHDWIGNLVQNSAISPVQLPADVGETLAPVGIEAVTYDGKTYGLPYAIENIAILRNTALADSTPATYDEMITKGQAAGTEYPFVVGLDPQASDPYHLYPFQTSFGSSVFARNADGSYDASKLTIGDESGQGFAAWLTAQGDTGTKVLNLNLSGDLAKEAFNAGKSPYFLTGPWNVADAQKAGIDVSVDAIPSAGGEAATRA